jgi:hypothetical protein
MTGTKGNRGYISVSLPDGKQKHKNFYVHILVAKAFLTKPDEYDMVNHIDGNKTNNTLENLEWTDASGNRIHAHATGLVPKGAARNPTCAPPADGVAIKDFPEYLVTPDGEVYSKHIGTFMNQGNGPYSVVGLSQDGKPKSF